jgi:hypothetical protein
MRSFSRHEEFSPGVFSLTSETVKNIPCCHVAWSLLDRRHSMKNIVLSCLAVVALISIVGCADDNKPVTTTDSSATMSSDSKNMTPAHH